MQALSSNDDFVEGINDVKKKKRKLKAKRGQTAYRYLVATNQNLTQFLMQIKRMADEDKAMEEQKAKLQENKDGN